ncbi:hypothetical protein Tco_1066896 [Tanacetum coccineum]|uniref:Uncharacterized protein n=1 Tax=Tanacetum coccineum TaxID=301880 RepID=A0ABQ5HBC9_9ASTR
MIGWLEENDGVNEGVNNEDIEDEDVEIELDDDAEMIFPYEVEGDKTLPHWRGNGGRLHVRDFPRGVFEVGEPSSAHDLSYVGGLAPWALRRRLCYFGRRSWLRTEMLSCSCARIVLDMVERDYMTIKGGNKRSYMEMVRIRAVPKPPSDDEDTELVPSSHRILNRIVIMD